MNVRILKREGGRIKVSSEQLAQAIDRIKKKGQRRDRKCKLVRGVNLIDRNPWL